jgi:hypothetical protein
MSFLLSSGEPSGKLLVVSTPRDLYASYVNQFLQVDW